MECIDRSKVSQALAKAIAYQNCGKSELAAFWAGVLLEHLKLAHILKSEEQS